MKNFNIYKACTIAFIGMLIALVLFSCSNTKTEYSPILHEQAVVVALIYSPSEHHTNLGTTMMDDFNNPMGGVDMNGNHGIKIGGGMQISESNIPEKYGVAFQCQHGTFTVEGSEVKHKVLYNKLHVKDTVDVMYKEEYRVTYKKNDKTGQKEVVNRVLNDLDFIDAQIVKKAQPGK